MVSGFGAQSLMWAALPAPAHPWMCCSSPQNTPVGTPIFIVNATDPDLGAGGSVLYSFQPPSPFFAIDSARGIVTVTRELDYETTQGYQLTVNATVSPPQREPLPGRAEALTPQGRTADLTGSSHVLALSWACQQGSLFSPARACVFCISWKLISGLSFQDPCACSPGCIPSTSGESLPNSERGQPLSTTNYSPSEFLKPLFLHISHRSCWLQRPASFLGHPEDSASSLFLWDTE